MDYFPNIDAVRYFCKDVFPLIRNALPDAEFHIVGRNPARAVRELARQPGVIVAGAVPDVRPFLMQAAIAVAPFRIARGIQNKVLEALAMGLPVVGTCQAFQGIKATTENGICVANEPEKFAKAAVALLKEKELRRTCSVLGRQYTEEYHRWEDHCAQLEIILRNLG
jgi:glycosyltransferase involved in cell wall biosynthesis